MEFCEADIETDPIVISALNGDERWGDLRR
jgi:hypothetical protein